MIGDDIRPRGTVAVKCDAPGGCGWHFWVDALDSRLPNGPFLCLPCADPRWQGTLYKCRCGSEEVIHFERCMKCVPDEAAPVVS